MTPVKNTVSLFFLLFLGVLFACNKPSGTNNTGQTASSTAGKDLENATLQFEFERSTDVEPPTSKVFLSVNGKRLEVATATGIVSNMSPGEYQQHALPESADLACKSWWAGAGEVYFVENTGTELIVKFYGISEESAPETDAVRELKRIKAADF